MVAAKTVKRFQRQPTHNANVPADTREGIETRVANWQSRATRQQLLADAAIRGQENS
jgi:hypothetical protein